MTTRVPRFEIGHDGSGYWLRFRAANGQILAWTETYTRKSAARHVAELIIAACNDEGASIEIRDLTAKAAS